MMASAERVIRRGLVAAFLLLVAIALIYVRVEEKCDFGWEDPICEHALTGPSVAFIGEHPLLLIGTLTLGAVGLGFLVACNRE